MEWMQVSEMMQAGTEEWVTLEGQNKWMMADGGPCNGGRWFHEHTD